MAIATNPNSGSLTGYHRLRRRLGRIGFLRSGWYLALALKEAWFYSPARSRGEFNQEFERRADPWNYDTTPCERLHHRGEAEMLDGVRGGGRFRKALEVGCAEGAFTEMLAERCEFLLASDVSPIALARARGRRLWGESVQFAELDLCLDPLPGTFDLIVVAHVLEGILNPFVLRKARDKLVKGLCPGGFLLIASTSDKDSVAENAWWGRYLIRGGERINAFMVQHPALTVVATAVRRLPKRVSLDVLCRKTT